MEERFCSQCNMVIAPAERCISAKKPGTNGNPQDYVYYHNREHGDCYWKHLRERVIRLQESKRTSIQ